jgi:flagellar protein FliO/FliZ
MDATSYLRFILALVLVLGLILGLAWALKRLGLGDGGRGPLTRRRRLRMVESTMVDSRHRVVLVRRDDVEHLVLVGPNTSQVIERGIVAPMEEAAETLPPAGGFRQFLGREGER